MNGEESRVLTEERIVLQKFEGEQLPENEIERITLINGVKVAHEVIENGEVVGNITEDKEVS